jgi:hypothetical protein
MVLWYIWSTSRSGIAWFPPVSAAAVRRVVLAVGWVLLTEDVQEQEQQQEEEEERHDYGIMISFLPLAAGALVPFVIRTDRAVAGCDTARGLLRAEPVALALR